MIEQKMLMFSKVNVDSLFSPFLPKQIAILLKGNFEGLHQLDCLQIWLIEKSFYFS